MQQRDWLHVDDNCSGILAALERGCTGEVYNLGGLDIEKNLSMAKRILLAMGKAETLIAFVKDRPGHDRRYALDSSKAEKELGWKRTISLDEGVRRTIEWYEANPDWLASVNAGEYRSYYEKYYDNRDSSLRAIARAEPKTLH
jgi:dTDP-glucose 4,6-dehydratase